MFYAIFKHFIKFGIDWLRISRSITQDFDAKNYALKD